jgi:hypothetical protein
MKNQYCGDVHDYRKYGLLRHLIRSGFKRPLVVWMLTPDDRSRDGRFRSYLSKPERYRQFDPVLFDLLRDEASEGPASVDLIQRIGVLEVASFHAGEVPDSRIGRTEGRAMMHSKAKAADLVFFDPDNGLEVKSKPVGRKGSSKYLFWEELTGVWRNGSSVVVYQHLSRIKRKVLESRLADELSSRTGAANVEVFRSPNVLFLFAAQDHHAKCFRNALSSLSESFLEHIAPVGLRLRRGHPS